MILFLRKKVRLCICGVLLLAMSSVNAGWTSWWNAPKRSQRFMNRALVFAGGASIIGLASYMIVNKFGLWQGFLEKFQKPSKKPEVCVDKKTAASSEKKIVSEKKSVVERACKEPVVIKYNDYKCLEKIYDHESKQLKQRYRDEKIVVDDFKGLSELYIKETVKKILYFLQNSDINSLEECLSSLDSNDIVSISSHFWDFFFGICVKNKNLTESLTLYFITILNKFPNHFASVDYEWRECIFEFAQKNKNITLIKALGVYWEVLYFFNHPKEGLIDLQNFSLEDCKKVCTRALNLENIFLLSKLFDYVHKNTSIDAQDWLKPLNDIIEKAQKSAIVRALENNNLLQLLPEINMGKLDEGEFYYDFSSGNNLYKYNQIKKFTYFDSKYKNSVFVYKQKCESERIKLIRNLNPQGVDFVSRAKKINQLSEQKLQKHENKQREFFIKRRALIEIAPVDDVYKRIIKIESDNYADYKIGCYASKIHECEKLKKKIKKYLEA